VRDDPGGWHRRPHAAGRDTAPGADTGTTDLGRIALNAAREWDHPLFVCGDRRFTAAELWDQGLALAAALRDGGLRQGDVIGVLLPNWIEAVVADLASSVLGLIVCPIVPIYRHAEVRQILGETRARAVLVPAHFRNFDYRAMIEALRPELPDLAHVVTVRGGDTDEDFGRWLARGAAAAPVEPVAIDPDDVKLILFTSGTTGRAKGVLHSHRTLLAANRAFVDHWGLGPDDVALMPSPVTHITGYLYCILLPFLTGGRSVMMDRWDPAQAVRLIEAEGVTFTIGATPFLQELVDEAERQDSRLPTLRAFPCGGAPIPPSLIERAHDRFERAVVPRMYGCTEAPSITLGVASRDERAVAATSEGFNRAYAMRLVDASGNDVEPGQEGEIRVTGPSMFVGYSNSDDNAKAFDERGYFRTGDLGIVRPDGALTISGREKDLIIRGGENISAKEVEDLLARHPAIAEVAVVAIPHARLGETCGAFVRLAPGARFELSDCIAFLEGSGCARQKIPERLFAIDAFPRTPTGKIQKNILRDEARRRLEAMSGRGADSVGN